MKYGDWTLGQTEALLNKLGGLEVARGILRGAVEVATKLLKFIVATFTVAVDETQSVEEAVKAGNFNWSNGSIISESFPRPEKSRKSKKKVVLFHFDKPMSSGDVIAEMDKVGYEPATIWDLLGLAVKEPDLQREFPIVALGSVWRRHSSCLLLVPYLYGNVNERSLDIGDLEREWSGLSYFLARRKYQK